MKIGYICSDIDIPLFGDEGCSIHVRDVTDAWVDIGHEVFILSASLGESAMPTKAKVYEIQPTGLEAVGWSALEEEPIVQDHHLERDLRSVVYNAWLNHEGAAIVERERPDFLCERYSLFGWGGIELARRYQIPLILEVNDPLCREQAGYERFTLTSTAERMEKEIVCAADAIVAVSEWVKDWVVSLRGSERDVYVIPNGVKGEIFRDQISGENVRARYGLTNKRVVGFLGSFQPWHDVKGLLRGFAELYGKDNDVRLFLVGNGGGRESLAPLINELGVSEAVISSGAVPHEMIPEYLGAMDVAVAPYDWKEDFYGSPLKLLEYMAAGRPTVAAAIGQIEKVIEHGKTGWLYASGDREELVKGLATLLYNPELSRAMGSAARQKALSDCTWQAIAARVSEIAQGLITSKAPNKKSVAA